MIALIIPQIIDQLRDLAANVAHEDYPWHEKPTFSLPTPESQLQELASKASFPLPQDLIEFFSITDEIIAMSVNKGYWIGGTKQILDMIEREYVPLTVEKSPCIPLATDGGGNTYLMTDSGSIYYHDHETSRTTQLAQSFSEFLQAVVLDWRSFIDSLHS